MASSDHCENPTEISVESKESPCLMKKNPKTGARETGELAQEENATPSFDSKFDQKDENVDSNKTKVCANSGNSKMRKGVRRCATFPSHKELSESNIVSKENDGNFSNNVTQEKDKALLDTPPYERSLSFPSSFKLVSAMKGGRAKNGTVPPAVEMRVKWAPDVHDPPTTSMSHTVRKGGYQPRSKSKKKENNNNRRKHKSKKASRGSGGTGTSSEKKSANSVATRPISIGEKGVPPNGYGKSDVEMKCGSEFLREALANMHFSTAEAL